MRSSPSFGCGYRVVGEDKVFALLGHASWPLGEGPLRAEMRAPASIQLDLHNSIFNV